MCRITKAKLLVSPYLSNLTGGDGEHDLWIMSPYLSSLGRERFEPIGSFLARSEYSPRLIDKGTGHARLEGKFTSDSITAEVERCGTIAKIAKKLEIDSLQELAVSKLKALMVSGEEISPIAMLPATPDIPSTLDSEFRQILVQFIIERF